MSETRFTKDHEWLRLDGGIGTCGITDYAQQQLGDVVFVELPEVGRKVAKGEQTAVVESVKAAAEIYAPVAGEVVATNPAIVDEPAKVNAAAMGEAWFFKLKVANAAELAALMSEADYKAYVEGLQ